MNMRSRNKPNGIELNQSIEKFREDLRLGKHVFSAPKMVACFGGSSIRDDNAYKEDAKRLANKLARQGISLVTGGGSGIMNSVNEGAYTINPKQSFGLRVNAIPKEEFEHGATAIPQENVHSFHSLAIRLLTLIGCSDAIVFFPGGFGTLEEVFSLLVRVRLHLMERIPIYFYGKKFWTGLLSWMASDVIAVGAIKQEDLDLFNIEDDIDAIAQQILEKLG